MNEIQNDIDLLAGDANALLNDTASAAAKRYEEARRGLVAVLERGKDMYGTAYNRAVRETKAVDGVMHENLYQTVLIGIGVGALLGFLVARRGGCGAR